MTSVNLKVSLLQVDHPIPGWHFPAVQICEAQTSPPVQFAPTGREQSAPDWQGAPTAPAQVQALKLSAAAARRKLNKRVRVMGTLR